MHIALTRKWVWIIVFDLFFFALSLLINPETTLMTLVLLVWSNGFIYTLEDLSNRGALFAFLISFFIILIGREALEVYGLHDVEAEFSDQLNRFTEGLLLISLVTLLLGYAISSVVRIRTAPKSIQFVAPKKETDYNSTKYKIVRNVSSKLFLITFAFNIFTLLDITLFVIRYGYIQYYVSYVSSVPYVIGKIGDMCVICFWIFLATMPDKRSVNRYSVLFIIYLILTLGTGKRFPFVAGLLLLFVYYILRRKINNNGETWIARRTLIWLVVLIPVLIILLYAVGLFRTSSATESSGLIGIFSDFFYDQGGSINVIKRAQVYQDMLPEGRSYLFGSTYEAISNNFIFRLLGAHQFSGNTVDHALNGYSFQHALSYVTMGSYYLSGHGLGSCYIAEAFHDLGYFGVILVNFIYGILLRVLFNFKKHGIWATAIILSVFYSLLLAPRGSADGFIADFVDLTTWGTIVVVWLISNILIKRSEQLSVTEIQPAGNRK